MYPQLGSFEPLRCTFKRSSSGDVLSTSRARISSQSYILAAHISSLIRDRSSPLFSQQLRPIYTAGAVACFPTQYIFRTSASTAARMGLLM
jgi:hypothetical protein